MKNYIENKIFNNHLLYRDSTPVDPYNPLNLPPYTIRLKYAEGVTPTFSKGIGVLVDASQNIWDLTYENNEWIGILNFDSLLIEVLGANTTNVTDMQLMFYQCGSLTSVPLFDTSKVTNMKLMFSWCNHISSVPLFDTSNVDDMEYMFQDCTSLTSVPLFNTSNVDDMGRMFAGCPSLTSVPLFDTSKVDNMHGMFNGCTSLTSIPLFDTSNVYDMNYMFEGCTNVQSGALALYQQASTQTNPPSLHSEAFKNCGINTQTGSAELAQIPSDWK